MEEEHGYDFAAEYYGGDFFITNYYLYKDDPGTISLKNMYFAFTSLSTVGFGDLAPRSDIERLVGSFVLLFGVAIFSMIMANFMDILTNL